MSCSSSGIQRQPTKAGLIAELPGGPSCQQRECVRAVYCAHIHQARELKTVHYTSLGNYLIDRNGEKITI